FFFQAEDGIRDFHVTGVQTCALPISSLPQAPARVKPQRGGNAGRRRVVAPQRCKESMPWAFPATPTRIGKATSRPARAGWTRRRSEERRVGKECRCRWAAGG